MRGLVNRKPVSWESRNKRTGRGTIAPGGPTRSAGRLRPFIFPRLRVVRAIEIMLAILRTRSPVHSAPLDHGCYRTETHPNSLYRSLRERGRVCAGGSNAGAGKQRRMSEKLPKQRPAAAAPGSDTTSARHAMKQS